MKDFFKRIPLPAKLILIGFIPLVFVIYLTFQLYNEKTRKVGLLKNYIDRIHQSTDITRLIDHLQMERDYSYDHALEKEKQSGISGLRAASDSIIQKLAKTNELSDFTSYTFLNDIAGVRSAIDSGKYAANQIVHYYTTIIFRLNTLNPVPLGAKIYLPEVYYDIVGQKLLSEMVTYLGISCNNVYNALYTKAYMVETLVGTVGVYQVFNTYEKEFLLKASPSAAGAYKNMRDNASLKSTVEYLDKLFKTFSFDSAYNAREWRNISGSAISQLRSM